MQRKFALIVTVFGLVLALGVANIIYAQGSGDDDAIPPCNSHPMWQSEDCPLADQENWQPDMMWKEGCLMQDEMHTDTTTIPYGGRGMMGMGARGGMNPRGGMMGMGSMMYDNNQIDMSTMPHYGMVNGMMGGLWSGTDTCNFEWEGEIPEEPTSAEVGDAENGALLFTQNACVACHDTTSNVTYVGPSLVGVSERADTRAEDMSAYSYLYQSIVAPNAHVVEGFAQSIMPPTFGAQFTEAQINDLIAYLLSL